METNVSTEREEIFKLKTQLQREYAKYNETLLEMKKSRQSIINAIERYDKCHVKCMDILANVERLLSSMSSIVYSSSRFVE